MFDKTSARVDKIIQKVNWREIFSWKARGGRVEYTVALMIVIFYGRVLWRFVLKPFIIGDPSQYTAMDTFLEWSFFTIPVMVFSLFFKQDDFMIGDGMEHGLLCFYSRRQLSL